MTAGLHITLFDDTPTDRRRLTTVLIRLSAATVLIAVLAWLVLEFIAPQILAAAYQGRSFAIFNSLITGQRDHPVGEYLAALSRLTRNVAFFFLALAAILAILASAAKHPSQRRPVALFLAFSTVAVVLSPLTISEPIGIFDEGFVVSGAMLIRQGALPIRDFFVIYGPGQYYLTAAVFTLFGEDLLSSRALHVLLMALLGVAVAACTSALVPRSRVWPLLTTLAYLFAGGTLWINPGYAAIPAVLLLLAAGMAYAQWAEAGTGYKLLGASLLVGLAGLFRWDFGVFGFLALTLTTGFLLVARRAGRNLAGRALGTAIVPGLALTVVVFTPFIWIGDATRWFTEVPLFLLLELKTWRNLEFVTPTLLSIEQSWSAGNSLNFSGASARLAYAAVAPCAALAAILIAGRQVWRTQGKTDRTDALALLLGVMVFFFLNQMRTRSGFPQGFPALVASLPLIAYVLAAIPTKALTQRVAVVMLSAAFAAVLVLAPLHVMQHRLRGVMAGSASGGVDLPRATTMHLARSPEGRRAWDEYAELVQHVRNTTRPGEPIFSGVANTSRLFINDAMLYFLTQRPAATRWVEMEPGLTSSERGQREVSADLERLRVRVLVLADITSSEPNATARSNGVTVLDDYIRARYKPSKQFGNYRVWMRRTD